MPPTCAIASTCSTPGMIGRSGKWPLKYSSLTVTCAAWWPLGTRWPRASGVRQARLLHADRPLASLKLDDLVNEQEGVAVREDTFDLRDVEDRVGIFHRRAQCFRALPFSRSSATRCQHTK